LKKSFRSLSFYIILPIVIIMLMLFSLQEPESGTLTFSELVNALQKEEVQAIEIGDTSTVVEIDKKNYIVEVDKITLYTYAGEDIEKRRALGLDIPEDELENQEETEESVFTDTVSSSDNNDD